MKRHARRVVESAVAWSFLGTFLRVGANVFVLPLVLRTLPPEHLAMWYVFGSLGSLALLLDLGFEVTTMRMAAYVWAGAKQLTAFGIDNTLPGEVADPAPNRLLFCDLLATLRAYYFALGLLVLLILGGGGGMWVWLKTAHLADAGVVRGAWLVYALGVCLNFVGGRWPALLGGIGQVRTAQQVAVVGLFVYYVVAILGLVLGFGLWALVGSSVLMGFILRRLGRILFTRAAALPGGLPGPEFHREIFAALWPNAWRTGLVSLGAFLIVQANTLICSAFLGLATTASYGLSFQLVSMLSGLSAVWIQVKLPQINQFRVAGQIDEISRVFVTRMRLVIASFFAGALVIYFLAPLVLQRLGSRTELLSSPLLATLLLIQFLEMHHSQYAALVLTENRNPFLRPALISGGLIVAISIVLTPRLGVWGLLISAGGVQLAFNNWWTVLRGVRGLRQSPIEYAWKFVSDRTPSSHVMR